MGRLFFLAVEINSPILAYSSAPMKVRKQMDLFCLTLAGHMSLSAKLFIKGTSLLKANVKTASFLLSGLRQGFFP